MKRSNSLIADFPPPLPLGPNILSRICEPIAPANLAGFRRHRQLPAPHARKRSVAPFYVETEAG
jgi:hypothetical protein